jgi:hypothetical protein
MVEGFDLGSGEAGKGHCHAGPGFCAGMAF